MDQRALARAVMLVALGCGACTSRSLAYLSSEHGSAPKEKVTTTPSSAPTTSELPTVTVLADRKYPTMLAADRESLYWVEQGTRTIMTMKKSGGDPHAVVNDVTPLDLVVDPEPGGYVFWVDGTGAVDFAPKSDAGLSPVLPMLPAPKPPATGKAVSLAVAPDAIYAAIYDDQGAYGTIVKVDRSGGATSNIVTNVYPKVLTRSGDRLFFFSESENDFHIGTAFGLKADNTTERYGPPEALSGADPRRFVVSGDSIFSAEEDTITRITTLPDASLYKKTFTTMNAKALAVDDEFLWVCDSNNAIRRAPKGAAEITLETVNATLVGPTSIVADEDGVWVTTNGKPDSGQGSLVKILREPKE